MGYQKTILSARQKSMRFDHQVAIVTGSTSGIGKSIATALTNAGCYVMLNSSKSVADGEQLSQQLANSAYFQADIADEQQCKNLIAATIERYGKLDFLINNAGLSARVPHYELHNATDELFNNMWNINLMGTWYMSRAAMPFLEKSDHGKILNISSVAGIRAVGSSIPYAISKAAVNHLTKLLANCCGPKIKINSIAPGFINTPRTETWDDVNKYISSNTALKKAGNTEDIASVALGVLASDYINGEIITIDGGFKLG